jgi:hypothetical protein
MNEKDRIEGLCKKYLAISILVVRKGMVKSVELRI